MKISIVIPTYNHCDDLLKPCIDSIIKYTYLTDIEVIISANGCKDNTKEYVESLGEPFKLVWNEEAIGYSRSTNAGIEASTGDYVVLLNNDIILLQQEKNKWLDLLMEPFIKLENVGISGPLKLYSPPAGREFIVFFCAMIKREVIKKIGLLDPIFGIGGGEDTDFCIKAESVGYTIIEIPLGLTSELCDEMSFMTGRYPIYHIGEATVHDKNCVSNWEDNYNKNSALLQQRYNMINPKIAVIIPLYNAEKTIKKTIDSILKQTYKNFDIFIVDDASTDSSASILKSYNNIYVHYKPLNEGVSSARNTALDMAYKISNPDLIAYCDSDDWWNENHLQVSVEHMQNTNSDIVYSKPTFFDNNGFLGPNWTIPVDFDSAKLKNSNYIWICSVAHKACLNPKFSLGIESLEDYDLWLDFNEKGYAFSDTKQNTVNYYVGTNTMASHGRNIYPIFVEKNKNKIQVKLNLGCGDDIITGWINIDAYAANAQVKADIRTLPYEDNFADVILVSHVIEHVFFKEAFGAINEWKRVLKPGGKLIIETPDLLETCRAFVEGDEQYRIGLYPHLFAFPEIPGQSHHFLYTETQLLWTLEQCGLRNIKRVPPDSSYSKNQFAHKQELYLRMECEK